MLLELALVVAGILILSGFFSGAEAALVSLSLPEVEEIVGRGMRGSHILKRVHRNVNRAVITIVIFNNVVNIVGSILVGQIVIAFYGDAILAVITTALTFGIIIFSEILPKSFGIHHAEKVALLCAPIIYVLTFISLPLIYVLELVTNSVRRGHRKVGTEAQIRSLVTMGRRAGHIESDEGQLIHRAFILNDKKAGDVMTPLKDITSVQDTSTMREAADHVLRHAYSRYPVFGNSMHEVKGLLLSNDILTALTEGKDTEPVTDVLREPLIVESDTPCDELIVLFRDKHVHLAIVQEEGRTVGVVSLEDVLEELVGEIEDETDHDA